MSHRVSLSVIAAVLLLSASSYAQPSSSSGIALVLAERVHASAVYGLATDSAGYIWAVGYAPAGIPTSPDALVRTSTGGSFLERIAPDGSLSYLTYLDSGGGMANAIALDGAGNIYVAGYTWSPDFPTTAGAYDRTCGADGTCQRNPDAFVMKLAPSGRSIVYSTYLGGGGSEYAEGIAVDASGRAHVAGKTGSVDFPVTAGAADSVLSGIPAQDGFYARLSADGAALEYSTYLGGSGMDDANSVAVDSAGRAYVAGWTSAADFPLENPLNSTSRPTDGFLARFGAAGLDYSTLIGGSSSDGAYAMAVSSTAVYLAGYTASGDFPGAPRACANACGSAVLVTKVRLDGGAILATTLLDGAREEAAYAITVDANDVVYVTGSTDSTDFPATQDAAQITSGAPADGFFAAIPMAGAAAGRPSYVTYLGGAVGDWGSVVLADGAGGAWIGGVSSSADFPRVNPRQNADGQAYFAHYARTGTAAPASDDVVLYARDTSSITGNWQLVPDATAAAGTRIWNPDAGVPKIGTASATPASFFELKFQAQAGVPYHLWLRMKADNDSWTNDSLFVQFSDSLYPWGSPAWQIGTTSAAMVSLEDCTGCGEHGWGWNDNGYDTPGVLVTFASSGTHTLRIQQREDGISVDQVVLSSRTYINGAPGAGKDDATILSASDGATPPSPPSDPKEIVMYVASDRLPGGQNWIETSDATAAGGARLLNPDRGAPKMASPSASGADYFDVPFTAQAGVPYHLWVRARATDDFYGNDSIFVQFSDSVDAGGGAIFRVGTDSATNVILEDCSGCGEQAWGWTDNAYGAFAAPIYFATSGPQTIRVLKREDGISIDQIVLSAGTYLNASPGAVKNDSTIVSR